MGWNFWILKNKSDLFFRYKSMVEKTIIEMKNSRAFCWTAPLHCGWQKRRTGLLRVTRHRVPRQLSISSHIQPTWRASYPWRYVCLHAAPFWYHFDKRMKNDSPLNGYSLDFFALPTLAGLDRYRKLRVRFIAARYQSMAAATLR